MSHQELLALIKVLREAGVTSFSHGDIKITFSVSPAQSVQTSGYSQIVDNPSSKPAPEIPMSQAELEATKRIKEMIATIQASPEELANQIFPAGAN